MGSVFAAVDLGASSGRVVAGHVDRDRLELGDAHRFPNRPVVAGGTLHWDILSLHAGVLDGLRSLGRTAELASVGIDTWGVDYGLLDSAGALLGNPISYRDSRTDGVAERVLAKVPAEELYARTGVQVLPFNTVFQIAAAAGTPQLAAAAHALLLPDLLSYWLTGQLGTERTNATTTGLLDARTGTWAEDLAGRVGVSTSLFPPLRDPGRPAGELLPEVLEETGLTGSVPVTAVGSHDTASAVVAIPAEHDRVAYISCGTWSLVGVELDAPVLSEASREANFSNEGGVDGTVRYLRNVMGLWLLQETLRTWELAGRTVALGEMLASAGRAEPFRSLVDPDDPAFLPPGDMPARIAAYCRRTGQPVPETPGEVVRCILDSLAVAYRTRVRQAAELSGRDVEVIHVVGGGALNELLCQLTADACDRPVVAGPVEATALGNLLVQARTAGVAPKDLAGMRALVRATQQLRTYAPRRNPRAWADAAARIDLSVA